MTVYFDSYPAFADARERSRSRLPERDWLVDVTLSGDDATEYAATIEVPARTASEAREDVIDHIAAPLVAVHGARCAACGSVHHYRRIC